MKRSLLFVGILLLLTSVLCRAAQYEVPLFLSADNSTSRSFLRIHPSHPYSMPSQKIQIIGYDDQGDVYGPIQFYGRQVLLSARDIERGNPDKGLNAGLGNGQGNWRLILTSRDDLLDIRVYATNKTTDSPFTVIHHVVQTYDVKPGRPRPEHYLPLDWDLNNETQTQFIRVFNRTSGPVSLEFQMPGAGAYGYMTLEPQSAATRNIDDLIDMMKAQWVFNSRIVKTGLIIRVENGGKVDDIGAMVLILSQNGSLANLSAPAIVKTNDDKPIRISRGEFHITLDFMEGLHEDWREAARYAADRWEQIITADYPDTRVTSICGSRVDSSLREVDDLIVRIEWNNPGPTSISGTANICATVRTRGFRGWRPKAGKVTIPWAYQAIKDKVRADRILIHEIGHILGLGAGTIWRNSGYVKLNTTRPSFTGPRAVDNYRRLFPRRYDSARSLGFTGVPLESNGSHWSDTPIGTNLTFTVRDDIMNSGGNRYQNAKITDVTVGALEDLGYMVDYSASDSFNDY